MDNIKTEMPVTLNGEELIPLTINEKEISELEALQLIKEGHTLNEFSGYTRLMSFAAVTYHQNGFMEIDENKWGIRLAKWAVERDYHALIFLPIRDKEEGNTRKACVTEFVNHYDVLTRKELPDFLEILNSQDNDFIQKAVYLKPSLVNYIQFPTETIQRKASQTVRNAVKQARKPNEEPFGIPKTDYVLIYENKNSIQYLINNFCYKKEIQTYDNLKKIIESNYILPDDFIESLINPLKLSIIYKKKGYIRQAEYMKAKVIPFINQEIIQKIAILHPEASIKTPWLIKDEYVRTFWDNIIRPKDNKSLATQYFLKFNEKHLTEDMLYDIDINIDTLNHAPQLISTCDNEDIQNEVQKYISTHPYEIFRMEEEYQTAKRLLANGVTITNRNIHFIKNEELRDKIKIALNIH